MKPRGLVIACCAGAASIALHAAGLVTFSSRPPQSLTGGAAQLAMIGNSFEDAIAGTISGASDPTPSLPVQTITPAAPSLHQARTQTAWAIESIRPTLPSTTAPALAATAKPVPAMPNRAAAAAMPSIAARDVPVVRTADADTVRPVARPRIATAQATPPRQAEKAPQGTAARTTSAGDAQGAMQGNATRTQHGQDGQSASDGRVAAQYPELVNRHLSKLRRPNSRFNGAAIVSFTISGNGDLAAASVIRSSGNAEFDRLALAHVQRAAPFPRPPAQAQRQFSVTVRVR